MNAYVVYIKCDTTRNSILQVSFGKNPKNSEVTYFPSKYQLSFIQA